jgi:hypothetical protein
VRIKRDVGRELGDSAQCKHAISACVGCEKKFLVHAAHTITPVHSGQVKEDGAASTQLALEHHVDVCTHAQW